MKRNPLLGSTLLAFVCLLSAGAISRDHSAMAQGSLTEGQLLAIDAQGKPEGQCPLKHTEVKTEISGFLARVIVTQQFANPFADKIEAVYTFPLPPAAAVDDMTIVVGNRTVKGRIMRREDAQATYDAARAKGQVAALLNQQRPNIFTQAVANILPGQQIDVTISYVETLTYNEGSYEWTFPMVVAPRYIPAAVPNSEGSPNADTTPQPADATPNERVPDAAQISPPVMPDGLRAGHDISIEVNIDAGVPLVKFESKTHEIEALQPGSGKAIVRLKDQATIPNQDFVLKYDVAGSQIEDALLFHRDDKGGFFTFILQPPQRVTVPDVMPKELVFVLDTSGSMGGFPIEKAKETMMLALDGLYPQDTFNVILFSGDTKILFPEPVPATKENLSKAKGLIAHSKGAGGTEMMKAIRAALAPSDAQDHVRIACFMTDGQVGNDMEIISEVQKHPHARVFAMGFGSAPNRFLLDKITEYGRGEVEYVDESGDTSGVAKRFHDRIRNPLLTDVSIDWGGLAVTDVYPKTIPDLFSAKPVIISGRYAAGGNGVIRLKGMMSGREFVREIPVELPEQETQHDVLATLWARRKVDDLMGQDMSGIQAGKMRDDLKTEIVNLGLEYRMMTQFTSFVAVEDTTITDGVEPRRVDVPVEPPSGSVPVGLVSFSGVSATVTVSADVSTLNATSADISNSITTRSIQNLPLNGRSFQGFLLLAPGTVSTGPANPSSSASVNISVNGQRPTSNQFTVDGVNGNVGISPGGKSPGASASGNTPALTATGATNPLASVGAVQEVSLRTYANTAEFGRNSGAQVSIVTKSGTNEFHGSAFYFFNHQAFDANDWFANSRGLARPQHGSNEFGGTFGGPIKRDRFFFFASYEGLRLRQPVVSLSDVPSLTARRTAPVNTQPLLNLFPLPNGPERPDGFAEFASSFTNSARHDTGSLHLDHHVTNRLMLSGYYNITDSSANERGAGGFSLNTLNRIFNRAQMLTGSATYTLSSKVMAEIRSNYSHFTSRSSYGLDNFGGGTVPATSLFSFSQSGSVSADLNGRDTVLMSGGDVTSTQRQLNTLGLITMVAGTHSISFGADYRRIFPIIGLRQQDQGTLFDGVTQALTGQAARVNLFTRSQPQRPVFNNLSIYGQDEWRLTTKLTLNYGLRWEVSPPPAASNGKDALAVTNVNDPAQLTLAATGTRLWATTYGSFAPRVGIAYQPFKNDELVVRGGLGVLYDAGNGAAGDVYADSYPFLNGQSQFNVPFSFAPTSSSPNSPTPITVPFSAFDPRLRMPYSLQWSASVERELGSAQTISAAYVGNTGRRLLLTSTLLNQNSNFEFLRLTNNGASSNYRSLQLQFNRRVNKRLGAMISYTWAKSVDNFSSDSAERALFRSINSELERGPSDFDIRHTLTGFVSYDAPALFASGFRNLLTRNWSIVSVFNVHSAGPVNVVYGVPTSFGFLYLRPDLIAGAPLYLTDAAAAGGRRINAAAFSVPQDLQQGTLRRNALRGFPLTQVNLALRRKFNFSESVKLTIGAEATNIFNHPNFAAPVGNDASLGTRLQPSSFLHGNPTFGQSYTNAARSPWGIAGSSFGANYYPGAARTVKLSAKFEF